MSNLMSDDSLFPLSTTDAVTLRDGQDITTVKRIDMLVKPSNIFQRSTKCDSSDTDIDVNVNYSSYIPYK